MAQGALISGQYLCTICATTGVVAALKKMKDDINIITVYTIHKNNEKEYDETYSNTVTIK